MEKILVSLIKQGVRFAINGKGNLVVEGNVQVIDDDTKALLKARKDEIKHIIHTRQQAKQRQIKIPKRDPNSPIPLSYSQQRLWFIDQLEGHSSQYNMPATYRISGSLDIAALQQSINAIVERHHILRTCYVTNDVGVAEQKIQAQATVHIPIIDLSDMEEAVQQQKLSAQIQYEAEKPFDLTRDLALRVSVIRLSATNSVLVFVMHHIASDGWSANILTGEMMALYRASIHNEEPQLLPLPVQYADFAAWQKSWLSGDEYERKLSFWKDHLEGLPQLHNLPTDNPRPEVMSAAGALHRQQIDRATQTALNALCKHYDVTLFMLLQAAYATLLMRYSHEKDIVMGTPVANRQLQELSPLIGFFANTLVLRNQFEGNPGFADFLQQVKRHSLNAYENQDVPFDLLVDLFQPQRNRAVSPLFQVMFILQNNETSELKMPGIELSVIEQKLAFARFDLTLSVKESDNGIEANWTYSTDLFKAETIELMAAAFNTLLRSIIKTPDCPVDNLNMLSAADQAQLINWNQTTQPLPPVNQVQALFERQVIANPTAVALVSNEEQLTYSALNNKANQLAHLLREKGVAPDTLVAVCIDRSADMVVAMLATLKAGGAYLPIDSAYPAARIEYMLKDANASVILTQRETVLFDISANTRANTRANLPLIILNEPDTAAALRRQPETNPEPLGDASNLAYIIYTSGSTGHPKGVMIEHHSLLNFMNWLQHTFALTPEDNCLLKSAASVDVSIWETLRPLCNGARLVLAKPDGQKDAEYLAHVLEKYQISSLHVVPTMLNVLLQTNAFAACSHLRMVSCGGEALSGDLAERFANSGINAKLYNFFGLSEATIDVCMFDCGANDNSASNNSSNNTSHSTLVPIGKPIYNTQLHVLSHGGQLQPIGAIGELYIAGEGLARGYINRPELTLERFVTVANQANETSEKSIESERLYKTGDLVRRLADGNLVYAGRQDQQVKVRGFRVEPKEIEAQILADNRVKECVVVAVKISEFSEQLVAYLVASQPLNTDAAQNDNDASNTHIKSSENLVWAIQDSLAKTLPAHMIPGAIMVLDAMPLTPNGKMDRNALPAPDNQSQEQYVAPRSAAERILCEIWQTLLGIERVGIMDNFFSIGGDSILSVQMVSRARQAGLTLNVRQLFEHQTIETLARHIDATALVDAQQTSVEGQQFLLPGQRCLLADKKQVATNDCQSVLLNVDPELKPAQVKSMVSAIYQRHDILRLQFGYHDGQWQGHYGPESEAYLEQLFVYQDARELSDEQFAQLLSKERSIEGNSTQEKSTEGKSKDIGQSPLFKMVYFERDAQPCLLLVCHSLLADEHSWQLLLTDIQTCVAQCLRGEPCKLADKSSSYQQGGRMLQEYAQSDELLEQRQYWATQLQATELVSDEQSQSKNTPLASKPLASKPLANKKPIKITLEPQHTQTLLHDCHQAYRTRIEELLLSALVMGLAKWSGCSAHRIDLVKDSRAAMREAFGDSRDVLGLASGNVGNVDFSHTLGNFATVYPQTLFCSADTAIGDVVKSIKEALRSVPDNGMGYGILHHLVQDTELQNLATRAPASVLFRYRTPLTLSQNETESETKSETEREKEQAGLSVVTRHTDISQRSQGQQQYPIELTTMLADGQLQMQLDCHGAQAESQEQLGQLIKQALNRIIEHCSMPGAGSYTPSDFPLADTTQAELDVWQREYPQLENLYGSTPMQKGLLFHSNLDSAAYVTQISMDILTPFNVQAFKQACQLVVNRHNVLRTAFVGEHYHQLVLFGIEPEWFEADWSGEQEQGSALFDNHVKSQKSRGFSPADAPLLRLSLVRVANNRYRFLWSSHHALLDGWSLSVIMGEIVRSYTAIIQGEQLTDTAPSIPYQAYIAWLQGQNREAAADYWRALLGQLEQPTYVSGLMGQQEASTDTSTDKALQKHPVTLSEDFTGDLQRLAKQHRTTLSTLVQGAWGYLLHRYSGEQQVVFGETVSGRPGDIVGVEQMVGLFINSLPVCMDFSDNLSLGDWLHRLHQGSIERSTHGHISLTEIQQLSQLDSGVALFDSLVVFENYPVESALEQDTAKGQLQVENLFNDEQTHYGITLLVVPGKNLRFSLQYDASRYTADSIERLMTHLQVILQGMVAAPQGQVKALPLMNHDEVTQLLASDEANQAGVANANHELDSNKEHTPNKEPLCAKFERYAQRYPANVAIRYQHQTLTYDALNRRANQFAHYLLESGVKPNDFVGLHLKRSFDLIVAILGVLKAGAAYIPLDPSYPEQRLSHMLSDSNMTILLTHQGFSSEYQEDETRQEATSEKAPTEKETTEKETTEKETRTIYWRNLELQLNNYSPDNPNADSLGIHADHLAYVLYTSGSTGKPKGVMIRRRSVSALIDWLLDEFAPSELANVLCSTSVNFDLFVFEFWAALASGNCLSLVDSITELEQLQSLSPTLINTVPSAVTMLLQEGSVPASVQVLNVAGEPLRKALVNQAFQSTQITRMLNLYGPTEDTTYSTYSIFCQTLDDEPTIGKPITGTQAFVLNKQRQLVPDGIEGELYLAGKGVAKGYLNLPELTRERFVNQSFTTEPGEPMYKTGDLVKRLPDGNLKFIGRIDHQVKLRGFRIELGEIESVLLKHHWIQSAVAVVDSALARILVYITLEDSHSDSSSSSNSDSHYCTESLQSYLKQHLPEYMLPGVIMVLDEMPLTPNGKIDRKALPSPDSELQEKYVAPRNAVEQTLCDIWQHLLGHKRVGVTDNFFSIGGDSISSIQVVSRAAKAGLKCTVKQLFEHQTIAELALHISSQSDPQTAHQSGYSAPQEPATGAQILLPLQQAFLDGLQEQGQFKQEHGNQSVLLHIPDNLQETQLRLLVASLYQRHDALRLRFSHSDQHWQGHYCAFDEALLDKSCCVVNVQGYSEAQWRKAIEDAGNCAQFDLSSSASFSSTEPLFKAVLFSAEAGRNRLLLTCHQLIIDDVSWRILLSDFSDGYQALSKGQEIQLAPKTVSLQQWGNHLWAHANSEHLLAEKDYWLSLLQQPVAALPASNSKQSDQRYKATEQVFVTLSEKETRALLQDCHWAYSTNTRELLLSGLYLGLRKWSGNGAFCLDLEASGRENISAEDANALDVSETLGWFTYLFPVLLHSSGSDIASVICATKEALRQVPNNGIGFGLLHNLLKDPQLWEARTHTTQPHAIEPGTAPRLLFSHRVSNGVNKDAIGGEQPDELFDAASGIYLDQELAGWNKRIRNENAFSSSQYALHFNSMLAGGGLRFSIDYHPQEYDRENMEALAANIGQALVEIINHCQTAQKVHYTPSDFPLATTTQAELDVWQREYPQLESLYASTPMQRGLLFHSAMHSSAYVTQISMDFLTPFNVQAFKQACQIVVDRHEVLRTAFVGEHYHQLVLRRAELEWFEADWSGEQEQGETLFNNHLKSLKSQGFTPANAPLMRLSLVRLANNRYRFLWSSHHALLDGWSLSVLIAEIVRGYTAIASDKALADAKLAHAAPPEPYQAYIAWLQQQDRKAAVDYWQVLLGEFSSPTHLAGLALSDTDPSDLASEGEDASEAVYAKHQVTLNQGFTKDLQGLAKLHQTTLSTLIQGAWGYLLHRYSGEQRVVFGETISGRPGDIAGVEQMVGLFISSLPVCIDFSDDQNLGDWLHGLHLSGIERSTHGHLPLTEIQQLSQLDSSEALFDSLVVFENYPVETALEQDAAKGQLQAENLRNVQQTHYGLTLMVVPGESLLFNLLYNANRYTADSIERLTSHFQVILQAMVAQPHGQVKALPLMQTDELTQLDSWQTMQSTFTSDASLWELFAQQVNAHPSATAITCDNYMLSYQSLYERAQSVAGLLLSEGIASGDFVGVCLPRSVDAIVSFLAIIRIGAVYVPIDPNYPEQHLNFMLTDSQVSIVVSNKQTANKQTANKQTASRFPGEKTRVVFIDDDMDHKVSAALHKNSEATADSVAYLMYTSGSTGTPKGVLVSHRNIARLVKRNNFMTLDSSTVFLQAASLSFDAATLEIWGPLLNGGRLVIYSQERADLQAINSLIEEQHINSVWFTAGLFEQWSRCLPDTLSLKWVLAGGDVIDPTSVERVYQQFSQVQCVNGYGPTENTTFSACYAIPRTLPKHKAIPLGTYINGSYGKVLQPDGFQAGVGMVGELWVGGDGVAKGYHRNDALTQEKFSDHQDRTNRMYRTGDLVCYLPSGNLCFLGRADKQVKVRGFRVELDGIVRHLLAHEQVNSCTVVTATHGNNHALVAYVVLAGNPQSDHAYWRSALRLWLESRMPAYMIPHTYMFVDDLPLTINGKVDRSALPPVDFSAQVAEQYVAPATPVQAELCAMWQLLLDVEQIGINDNFFELGGHSLLAVRLKSQILADFKLDISMQTLFKHQTISLLSAYIEVEVKLNSQLNLDSDGTSTDEKNDESEVWEL